VGRCSPDLRAIWRYCPGRAHQIYRQGIPKLREAIGDLSKGRAGDGFDKLDRFGVIREIANDDAQLAAIAEKQIEALEAQRSSLDHSAHTWRMPGCSRRCAKGDEREGSIVRLGTFVSRLQWSFFGLSGQTSAMAESFDCQAPLLSL
jgi:hypothetical protein